MNSTIKRILLSAALAGGLFSAVAATPALAAPVADLKGTDVVLVHGAFADGSSWNKVIPLLEARGLHVVAVQNPLGSLADDVAATRRAIEQQTGPVVLVGHSWAGVVISEAGNDQKVKSLVYVAAFAPDSGQSIADLTKDAPPPAWVSELRKDSAGFMTLSDKAIREDFAPDLTRVEQNLVAATQGPWFGGCVTEKVAQAAWRAKPSSFVVATQDRMIDPALQQAMATRIGATITRVKASHVAMLSQPRAVADAIIAAAERVKQGETAPH
ncbi:alpha/beta fold hydrolase [Burkholderia sp. Ac-20379]|uniref:alpha/beta fold hydrolase n=1 Tax=Burkholderia sp. Ac-20379 TaxID=2703900 RepID=UPI00197CBACD|nr:alpha/beta hydrolase [Burkholderia sp. Ac-20379]MBN3724205.1 alpha/beta hydrolase [Burkholderia sp. Ac-20379]